MVTFLAILVLCYILRKPLVRAYQIGRTCSDAFQVGYSQGYAPKLPSRPASATEQGNPWESTPTNPTNPTRALTPCVRARVQAEIDTATWRSDIDHTLPLAPSELAACILYLATETQSGKDGRGFSGSQWRMTSDAAKGLSLARILQSRGIGALSSKSTYADASKLATRYRKQIARGIQAGRLTLHVVN